MHFLFPANSGKNFYFSEVLNVQHMKLLKAIFSSIIAIGLLVAFNFKVGNIPPIGKFLDPFGGFWANAETKNQVIEQELKLEGLKGEVIIRFDENRIPHIFATNDHDLYFAQGFITAKDRLWQLDFQTRFAAGRLSEVVGYKAVELDKYQRRMGMTYGAEKMVEEMKKDPVIFEIVSAYTNGINEYIQSLSPAEYPIEFKILDYHPEEWKPLNCALLLKLMSSTLASGSDEFYMSNILNKYGSEVVKDLFPDYPFREDPIIPSDTKWTFKPVEVPAAPAVEKTVTADIKTKEKVDGIGSNNWAVAGEKSASGYPLLANDPHLDLTLPAIWYQVQLASPGVNVAGVAIPGAPGVIIGFNRDVAWGVTNVGADVLDWYQIRFKDQNKSEYWHDNRWKPVQRRVEQIAVRGRPTISDTVIYTHHGPVVYTESQKPSKLPKAANVPTGNALRWIAHLPSNDVRTFYQLNRAKNYDDYREALTHYTAPAQNFVFASIQNDISITPNGYFPLKWKNQGKFILDGSLSANDWHGRIPAEQNPTVKNPPRGFVSSANQSSTDPTYPYYINWEFSASERARRINSRLTVMTQANVDSMRNLQNDNYSILAQDLLPSLVGAIQTDLLNASEKEGLEITRNWNKFYNADEVGASIFEIWHKELISNIWKDDFGDQNAPMRYPARSRTVALILNEPEAKWFDNVGTPQKETFEDVNTQAFKFAIDSLTRAYGPIGKNWQWANVKHSHVPHLAAIAGLGSKTLYNGGSKHSVNALGEKNGPSWRMIVALGPHVKAYGVFPGGQSGNPGSFYYDNMINTWTEGALNELLYLESASDQSNRITSTLKLR